MAVSKNTHQPTPRANPPQKPLSELDMEPDTPVRPPNYPPEIGINFTEAVGKTVAYINYVDDAPEWQSLQVRFTDGTLLAFDLLPRMRVRLRVQYMESRGDELETIRNYGIVEDRRASHGQEA